MNRQQEDRIDEIDEESSIDLRRIIGKYIAKWPWFVISVLFCFALGYLYVRYDTPIYKINARVLVNDEKKGGGLGASDMLGDLGGLLGGKSTVDNEAEILKSRLLMENVVKDLNLNFNYFKDGRVKEFELYRSPFIIRPIKLVDTVKSVEVKIKLLANNKVRLNTETLDTVVNYNNFLFLQDVGYVQLVKNSSVPLNGNDYIIKITSVDNMVTQLMNNVKITVGSKLVTIIDLSLNHAIPKKGEDILNRLIYNYRQGNLSDKNEVADSTIAFIKRRLLIIGGELGGAEGNIQEFKQRNNLADMSEQGKLLVNTTSQYVSDLAKIETQISILNGTLDYLKDDARRVLPSSLMPGDLVFTAAIQKYNTLLVDRTQKLMGLTESNPVILNIDKEISNSREDIKSIIGRSLDGLIITRNKLNRQINQAEGQIQQVPETERNYLKLARQQQIKQELYIF